MKDHWKKDFNGNQERSQSADHDTANIINWINVTNINEIGAKWDESYNELLRELIARDNWVRDREAVKVELKSTWLKDSIIDEILEELDNAVVFKWEDNSI